MEGGGADDHDHNHNHGHGHSDGDGQSQASQQFIGKPRVPIMEPHEAPTAFTTTEVAHLLGVAVFRTVREEESGGDQRGGGGGGGSVCVYVCATEVAHLLGAAVFRTVREEELPEGSSVAVVGGLGDFPCIYRTAFSNSLSLSP